MKEYLERSTVINRLQEIVNDYEYSGNMDALYVADYCLHHIIELKPAADVRPVARGRKEKAQQQPYFRGHFPTFVCSECHREVNKRWNYCPNCGARMDGGVNNGKG